MSQWQQKFDQVWQECADQVPPNYWKFYQEAGEIFDSPDGPDLSGYLADKFRELSDWLGSQTEAQGPSHEDRVRFHKFKLLAGFISRLPEDLKSSIAPDLDL